MILYILYLLVFLGLIYFTDFFGLFKDDILTNKKITLLFFGKALAVPVFLYLYTKLYGGIDNLDTGKFYHDVKVIYDYGKTDLNFLLRLLFGLQDDNPGSADYEHVLKNTLNWDNGTTKDYLYNDNRVVIRLHVLLNLFAFDAYPVHALFSCFLSFVGIFYIYKSFKDYFPKREFFVLIVLCFFPSLWFYTGAVLKEGITLFVLGCTLYQLRKFLTGLLRGLPILGLLFLVFMSVLLKPYLLIFSILCFGLFFRIEDSEKITRKILSFFSVMLIFLIALNTTSLIIKHKSLTEAALKHQQRFTGVSKGGIFLSDSITFIRLSNDTNQIIRISGKKDVFSIRKNTRYMYWRGNENDTLFVAANQDTSSLYELAYIIKPSNSNINLPQSNLACIAAACLYYTLFYPTVFTVKNAIQVIAATENLVIFFALLILLFGFFKVKKQKFLPLTFLFFTVCLCLLIGFTAPNSGAIFRYRSPAMVFLLLAALYYFNDFKAFFSNRRKP